MSETFTSKQQNLRTFWLSFCDTERPEGQQFLGVCIVDVTEDEAKDAEVDLTLRFPTSKRTAEEWSEGGWCGAALQKAWTMGCNPGGQVMYQELPFSDQRTMALPRNRLLNSAECEELNQTACKAKE